MEALLRWEHPVRGLIAPDEIAQLRKLKELGRVLAVDDFGTGYSSLDYLRRFPIDVLKIARSFVEDLRDEGEGTALVKAIIELARSFDLTVIAEGIEDPLQRERLLELGCEFGQGFHLARAADAATIDSLLIHSAVLDRGERTVPPGSGAAPDAG